MTPNILTCAVAQPVLTPVTNGSRSSIDKEKQFAWSSDLSHKPTIEISSKNEQCHECNDNTLSKPLLLESIFSSHRVTVPPGPPDHMEDFDAAIESLELLIDELKSVIESGAEIDKKDSSPGFMTIDHDGTWVHHINQFSGIYETLADNLLFPMPSPTVALHCFSQILKTWKEKKLIVKLKSLRDDLSFCSCFDEWRHCHKKDIMMELANHTLEQVSSYHMSYH